MQNVHKEKVVSLNEITKVIKREKNGRSYKEKEGYWKYVHIH